MKNLIYVLFFCALFIKCANVKPPSGGPIDTLEPTILYEESTPERNGVTNYSKDYIELKFSEKVKTVNTYQEIIITPSLNDNYSIDNFNNVVRLEFEKPLSQNTTYIVNFGNSIVDLTESNQAKNVIVAFSTGETLDSLSISGNVSDNLTDQKKEGILVGLYREQDTTTILNAKPYYFVKTLIDGSFTLPYLKKGTYNLFALEDKNNNSLYDAGEDQIAFLPTSINLDTSLTDINLRLFTEDLYDSLSIITSSYNEDYFSIELNNDLKNLNLNSSNPINYKFIENTKELLIYNDSIYTDTLLVHFSAQDSLSAIDSTFKIKFPENKERRNTKAAKKTYSISTTSDKKGFQSDSFKVEVTVSKPYKTFNTDSIYLVNGNDTTSILNDTNVVIVNKDPSKNQLEIIRHNNRRDYYQLIFKKGTFISFDGDTSTQTKRNISKADPENYGTLAGTIKNPYPSIIAELIDSKYKITRKLINPNEYRIMYLDPETYSFRILIDINQDGRYQYGNFEKRLIPEPVYFSSKSVKIKTNWEISDFNVDVPKIK